MAHSINVTRSKHRAFGKPGKGFRGGLAYGRTLQVHMFGSESDPPVESYSHVLTRSMASLVRVGSRSSKNRAELELTQIRQFRRWRPFAPWIFMPCSSSLLVEMG